ncbi:carboxypeptidase-like regulatory domain-containing protein [Halorussus gelatinilyticus]|uniref:Carboxypeptidase-like regulatory domain-containing protein n=1 Tax=Halorussus gelatinilyticus TaxID=2937524 RepID=A0A8U0IGD1_9EURY|nr:carboxypeptidase-like regulatory domain-containing protein [Halorussus gelatinilyticus]UPW00043.1 carboxypeptidase-like regulatory domain-containing protein [Halorussus gelatinilyticus]
MPPHQVSGTITDQNGDAVSGVSVEIVYDGTVINQTTTDSDGYYEFKVPDPNDDKSGETLSFVVDGDDTGKQVTWSSPESSRVDFTVETDTGGTSTPDDGSDDDSDNDDSNNHDSDNDGSSGSPGAGSGGNQNDQNDSSETQDTVDEDLDSTTEGAKNDDESSETKTATVEPTEETAVDTTTDEPASTESTTTTEGGDGGIPGFGIGVALVAGALLVVRRSA